MKFVDRVRIWARAGKGGRGCLSFLKEKFRPNGGPDGGNGGKGGDIILKVNPHLNNLRHLSYVPHQLAKDGKPGKGKQMTGGGGKNLVIEVPPGTIVSSLGGEITQEDEALGKGLLPTPAHGEDLDLIADMVEEGEDKVLCKGGRGGRGNMSFKSSKNRVPREFQPGGIGEEGQFLLELKSIADVGFLGYPNAGKSSLLSVLSKATPKIASYPFTTLSPMIGVCSYDDFRKITLADIPGLIENAHQGVGLGHAFLRHIERCRLFIFVLDIAGSEGRNPLEDFASLRKEIKLYEESLASRPFFVVANKIDMKGGEEHVQSFRQKYGHLIIEASAKEKIGLEEIKKAARSALEKMDQEALDASLEDAQE